MNVNSQILERMIKNELEHDQASVISHHEKENPHRIDVARDEIIFIHQIKINAPISFWLE